MTPRSSKDVHQSVEREDEAVPHSLPQFARGHASEGDDQQAINRQPCFGHIPGRQGGDREGLPGARTRLQQRHASRQLSAELERVRLTRRSQQFGSRRHRSTTSSWPRSPSHSRYAYRPEPRELRHLPRLFVVARHPGEFDHSLQTTRLRRARVRARPPCPRCVRSNRTPSSWRRPHGGLFPGRLPRPKRLMSCSRGEVVRACLGGTGRAAPVSTTLRLLAALAHPGRDIRSWPAEMVCLLPAARPIVRASKGRSGHVAVSASSRSHARSRTAGESLE